MVLAIALKVEVHCDSCGMGAPLSILRLFKRHYISLQN